ncbi:DUF3606 domain-containing protein [Sphingobium sp. BHU LFT2]|uniref:DUF3606 domain-containing protein n=1 Tax=Sphingobium sp. BHU LFT2 TaxID=2807634 RepID=UPI001BED3740|nr:DUF3606 domain-containing protein [Sphingobium sp. BHU LFT2]
MRLPDLQHCLLACVTPRKACLNIRVHPIRLTASSLPEWRGTIRYWTQQFRVDHAQMREAVDVVGSDLASVAARLNK